MLTLLLGRSGSGKSAWMLHRLCEYGAARPQVLMVPEQQSHEMERALCEVGGSGVSLFAEVLSFSRLANRVFLTAGGLGTKELDQGGRLLLMYQAAKAVSSQLTVLSRAVAQPRFLKNLLITTDELKGGMVRPVELQQACENLEGPEGNKLRDLALIYGAYDALTVQVALDPRDRLTRAAGKLARCGWAEGKDFWLDGFIDFTKQQLELIRQLLRQGEHVTVALTCGGMEEEEDIFRPAQMTAGRLVRLAQELNIAYGIEQLASSGGEALPPLRYLEKHLFSAGPPKSGLSCCEAVELFAARTVQSEVEWAAARIRSLVREQGYRLREIGLVARNFSRYGPLIESVFQRYEVPVFCARKSDILEKPVLALVTAALDAISGGYHYDDIFRYLKTGLTSLPEEDRDLLENYVLKWEIHGRQWTQKKPWSLHPVGYGMEWSPEDKAVLQRLEIARNAVIAPLRELEKNGEKTGAGQARALYSFLEQIDLPGQLQRRLRRLRQEGELVLAEEYRQLWEILCTGLEQCAAILGETPMQLEEFAQLLRLVLSQYEVGAIPVSLDRVTAGDMTRQTGHRVKILFLLGAEDGALPMAPEDGGILSDDDRSFLATFGIELGQTGQERLLREMTTVYHTCARPQDKLVVSWPARGPGGEECRPSFLIERLRLIFSDLRPLREEELAGRFRLAAPFPALEQAGRNQAAYDVLSGMPGYARLLGRMDRAARWERGCLSRPAVDAIYGHQIPMSASRMDQYKSCHFAYFMRYGLKARPRKPSGFAAPEYGTFVHYVLEHVLQEVGDLPTLEEGEGISRENRMRLQELTDAAVERYIQEELGGLEQQTDRFCYLFHRLCRGVRAVVENAVEELCYSKFRPVSFELGFSREGELPPVELTVDDLTVSISGFVDRVDGWEHDGRLYLRVVDYKTGRKSFDLTEVWNGLGLQMLLYLFTLEQKGNLVYHQEVEKAGVLYLPAREVIVQGRRGMSEEALGKALDQDLRRRGIVLDDPAVLEAMERPRGERYRFLPLRLSKRTGTVTGEALVSAQRFGRLQKHIESVLHEICQELAAGNINADPFWRGPEKNACRFCDFTDACHFEEGRDGDCRRWLPTVTATEFWQHLEKQAE